MLAAPLVPSNSSFILAKVFPTLSLLSELSAALVLLPQPLVVVVPYSGFTLARHLRSTVIPPTVRGCCPVAARRVLPARAYKRTPLLPLYQAHVG